MIWVLAEKLQTSGSCCGTRWGWKRLFSYQFWRWYREYIWHDSFGQYWNRWIICRWFGHNLVQNIADPSEETYLHCFACERRIIGPYIGPVNRLAISKFRHNRTGKL